MARWVHDGVTFYGAEVFGGHGVASLHHLAEEVVGAVLSSGLLVSEGRSIGLLLGGSLICVPVEFAWLLIILGCSTLKFWVLV